MATMTYNAIPLNPPNHLQEVKAGLTLLEMLERTGGHNIQTKALISEKMEIDLQQYREQINRR